MAAKRTGVFVMCQTPQPKGWRLKSSRRRCSSPAAQWSCLTCSPGRREQSRPPDRYLREGEEPPIFTATAGGWGRAGGRALGQLVRLRACSPLPHPRRLGSAAAAAPSASSPQPLRRASSVSPSGGLLPSRNRAALLVQASSKPEPHTTTGKALEHK